MGAKQGNKNAAKQYHRVAVSFSNDSLVPLSDLYDYLAREGSIIPNQDDPQAIRDLVYRLVGQAVGRKIEEDEAMIL